MSGSESADFSTSRALAVLPTPSRIDLKTIDDVRVEMAKVYRDMRAGRLETADGTKLAYVFEPTRQAHRIRRAGEASRGAGRRAHLTKGNQEVKDISKQYQRHTQRQLRLWGGAVGKKDEQELDRLENTCPRKSYTQQDWAYTNMKMTFVVYALRVSA